MKVQIPFIYETLANYLIVAADAMKSELILGQIRPVVSTFKEKEEESKLCGLKLEIETLIHYPVQPYKQVAFSNWNNLVYPITEKIHYQVLSLPMYPQLTKSQLNLICNLI